MRFFVTRQNLPLARFLGKSFCGILVSRPPGGLMVFTPARMVATFTLRTLSTSAGTWATEGLLHAEKPDRLKVSGSRNAIN